MTDTPPAAPPWYVIRVDRLYGARGIHGPFPCKSDAMDWINHSGESLAAWSVVQGDLHPDTPPGPAPHPDDARTVAWEAQHLAGWRAGDGDKESISR